uniref:Uncharacterized protein n=1 Tax=Glossina brevipalpis TaxID=37001 RepID=A0A1A9WNB7_9MUSC
MESWRWHAAETITVARFLIHMQCILVKHVSYQFCNTATTIATYIFVIITGFRDLSLGKKGIESNQKRKKEKILLNDLNVNAFKSDNEQEYNFDKYDMMAVAACLIKSSGKHWIRPNTFLVNDMIY